jgi:flagellar FliJ protein
MKKFHFSLDNVKHYKEQLLKNTEMELGKINETIAKHEELEEENRRRHYENDEYSRQWRQEGLNPQMMVCYADYRDQLHKEYQVLLQKKAILMKERDNIIEKIVGFKVEIATLDKLKENELLAYRAEERKEDERLVEEYVGFQRVASQ